MEDPTEFLMRAAINLKISESMKGKKPTHRAPRYCVIQMHEQQYSNQNNFSQSPGFLQSITSFVYPPCTQPLSSLQHISLTDLVLETVHRGKCLFLRTIVNPKQIVAIATVVEDPEGNVEVLQLYNQNPNRPYTDIIPNDSIIVLKEPYYKISAQGGTSLRCDHPTDLIFLDANDPLVQDLKWKTGTPKAYKILTVNEYKTLGNDYFKQGKFYEAIKAYSNGISSSKPSDPEMSLLSLNRAQARLRLNHFEGALNDSLDVLKENPHNIKALYRSVKAHYGLENYDEALAQLKKLLTLEPNNKDGQRELSAIVTRIKERRYGLYDFNKMIEEAKKSSNPRLEHASFVGPVQITEISKEKGRGLVLTEDVRKGQLLLCTKAFAITYPTEFGKIHYINTVTKLIETGDHGVNTAQIINKLSNNPSLAPSFFQLYAGPHRIGQTPPSSSEPIDSFWVSDICSMNTFGVSKDGLNHLNESDEDIAGLFILPSLINHACCENVLRSYIGDMMIIRAAYDLTQGTELLLSYTATTLLEYDERSKILDKHKFICNCTLCQLDRAEPQPIRNKRELTLDEYQEQYRLIMHHEVHENPNKAFADMLKMVTNIGNTYNESGRKKYRFGLMRPLMALGKMYSDTNDTQNAIKTYKKVLRIHEFDLSTNNELSGPLLFTCVVELCLLYFRTSQMDKGHQLLKRLREVLVVTPTGDDRIFIETNRHIFQRVNVCL